MSTDADLRPGAGSSGTSAAYYINKFRDPCQQTTITVYERAGYVGGRSTTVNVFDDPRSPVELGASIFVSVNRNLVAAAKEFGLTTENAGNDRPNESPETLGIWDGEKFVYTQSSGGYYWWNIAKLLWKYGLSPIRTQKLMKNTVGDFLKMYEAPYFPFASLSEVAYDLGLTAVTSVTGHQFLLQNSIQSPFSTDIIQASTRVNYAQNLGEIHGLESMVCMATDGAMAVKGGNWQIFDGMLKSSGAHLFLNTTVTEISRRRDGTYAVQSSSERETAGSEEQQIELYDTVIVAAPLQFSNIKLTPTPQHLPGAIPYVKLHVSLFASPHRLSPRAFNLPLESPVPEVILTTLSGGACTGGDNTAPTGFFSVSTLRTVTNPFTAPPQEEYLYKVFSPQSLNSTLISRLLGFPDPKTEASSIPKKHISWLYEKVWDSYPYLPPRVTFDDPLLDTNLWYTSGIESFISTMETSSLMGMNVARLITDDWMGAHMELTQHEL